jgi:phospholipid transport system substrate-binding protein
VTNYRGSFNTQVRQGGIDGLIQSLTEKNKHNVEAGAKK